MGAASALPDGAARATEIPVCTTINSNATLSNWYSGLYDSLANNSKDWAGGINVTPPDNQSAYPKIADGDRLLIAAWSTICDSAPYQALYGAWGASHLTSGSQLNGSSGHYEFNYGFVYLAPCSDPTVRANGSCEFFTTWTVDLVTEALSGPTTTREPAEALGGPPAAPGPGADGIFGPLSPGGSPFGIALVVAAALATTTAVILSRRYGRGGVPPTTPPPRA